MLPFYLFYYPQRLRQYRDQLFLWLFAGSVGDIKCVAWMSRMRFLYSISLVMYTYKVSIFFFTIIIISSTGRYSGNGNSGTINSAIRFFHVSSSSGSKKVCGVSTVHDRASRKTNTTTTNRAKRFYDCFIFDCFRAFSSNSIRFSSISTANCRAQNEWIARTKRNGHHNWITWRKWMQGSNTKKKFAEKDEAKEELANNSHTN